MAINGQTTHRVQHSRCTIQTFHVSILIHRLMIMRILCQKSNKYMMSYGRTRRLGTRSFRRPSFSRRSSSGDGQSRQATDCRMRHCYNERKSPTKLALFVVASRGTEANTCTLCGWVVVSIHIQDWNEQLHSYFACNPVVLRRSLQGGHRGRVGVRRQARSIRWPTPPRSCPGPPRSANSRRSSPASTTATCRRRSHCMVHRAPGRR